MQTGSDTCRRDTHIYGSKFSSKFTHDVLGQSRHSLCPEAHLFIFFLQSFFYISNIKFVILVYKQGAILKSDEFETNQ